METWQEGLEAAKTVEAGVKALLDFLQAVHVLQEGLGPLAVQARQVLLPLDDHRAQLAATIASLQQEIQRRQEELQHQRQRTSQGLQALKQQEVQARADHTVALEVVRAEKVQAMQALDATWADAKTLHNARMAALDRERHDHETLHQRRMTELAQLEAALRERVTQAEARLREIGAAVQRLGRSDAE